MLFCCWWIKKDFRIHDNDALANALEHARLTRQSLVAVYFVEPSNNESPDYHPRRDRFVLECIEDLAPKLLVFGVETWIKEGSATEGFSELVSLGLSVVFSHEETGLMWTYERDKSVNRLLRLANVNWIQLPTNGVVRRLPSRDIWRKLYKERMAKPNFTMPASAKLSELARINLISAAEWVPGKCVRQTSLGIASQSFSGWQQGGGENLAQATLNGFLNPAKYRNYLSSVSNPLRSQVFNSRLSPYLAFGCLSSRQVHNAINTVADAFGNDRNLIAVRSRLAWRCHFIQKLEDFPNLEAEEVNSALGGRRLEMTQSEKEAWIQGTTGVPFVDACLRAVHTTGFLNFRMRAMLMSFATHLLFRDWRWPAWDLAQSFLDFEPGIHFSQTQMQAAVTGNNMIRIYSPLKQAKDHDSQARFIKQWVPELAHASVEAIHAATGLPVCYPVALVDVGVAMKTAQSLLFKSFKEPEVRAQATVVQNRLGSRSKSWKKRIQKPEPKKESQPSSSRKTRSRIPPGSASLFDEE